MAGDFVLTPGTLTLRDLRALIERPGAIALDPASHGAIDRSAAVVQAVIDKGETAYGINTGFGALARTHIKNEQLTELQRRLVLSHAAGTGDPLSDSIVRAILILKINGLARGFSGIRRHVIEALLALVNAEVYPRIPAKGSVGASGDLAPLAHMSATLLGIGEVSHRGKVLSAIEGLKIAGLKPIDLAAKEGLALLNGTQVSTALAATGLFAADDLLRAGLIAGAMSTDAALGSDAPFDPRIHAVRGQLGQIEAARALKALMEGSALRASHIDCDRVQDPYSLRCQPQVMGAALDQLRHAADIIARECNAVSDNPLVFADQGDIVSGGNFHAEPVALAADGIALAIAEIGAISERRTALLTDARMSNLPAFLSPDPGLNSGFMIAHVTAAALASENKLLAHPASVDSLPTSANQEDHVSMATHGARRLHDMADNSAGIVGIELLAAAQGIELRRPVATSPRLQQVLKLLRADTAFWDQDRLMAPDIAAAKRLVRNPALREVVALSAI
ncbi:MAG TPA: histidine ammonia-lyase [Dongiaceae bacterium]|jgi:histidine ammonia-lyase|nr:histidine ammonia-lyase [Dongiaceae bacterium]